MEKNQKIKNYKNDNKLNLEEIIDKYSGYVYKVVENAAKQNLSKEDIEEIIADTFFVLWKNREKLEEEKPLNPYLAGIARNLVREKFRNKHINMNLSDYENIIVEENKIELKYEQREKINAIETILNKMSKEDITIFNLYYYEERKIKEIANILNFSEFKIKSKLYRIRKKIKKDLEKGGYRNDG